MQATSNVNAKGKTGMTGKKEERCLEKQNGHTQRTM